MTIDFKDQKGVDIDGFNFTGTYEDHLEGSRKTITENVLSCQKSRKGLLYLPPELVDGELKPYVCKLHISYRWEHRLTIVWYDDDIPSDMPFINYLQEKVKDVEFETNCEFFDLDNL